MPSGRCVGCGRGLPRDARFCPRCGVGVDEVPVLGLADDDASHDDDEELVRTTSATRTLAALALGLVVLVVVLTALSGDGNESGGSDEDASSPTTDLSTTESTRRTSTTSRLGVTTTTLSLGSGDGVAEAEGFVLLVLSYEGLSIIDLGTGSEILVDGPTSVVNGSTLIGGHLVSVGSNGDLETLDLRSGGPWLPLELEGFGQQSTFPLRDVIVGNGAVLAADDDGDLRRWDLPASVDAFAVVGSLDDRLVVNGYGTVFTVTSDRAVQAIATGQAISANESGVVVISCDERLRCNPRVIDVEGEALRIMPALPDGAQVESMTVSPDLRTVIAGVYSVGSLEDPQRLIRHDAETGGSEWEELGPGRYWRIEAAQWTADGTTALWWSPDANVLEIIGPEERRMSVPRASDVTRSDPFSTMIVRLEDLSPAWREALGR